MIYASKIIKSIVNVYDIGEIYKGINVQLAM